MVNRVTDLGVITHIHIHGCYIQPVSIATVCSGGSLSQSVLVRCAVGVRNMSVCEVMYSGSIATLSVMVSGQSELL